MRRDRAFEASSAVNALEARCVPAAERLSTTGFDLGVQMGAALWLAERERLPPRRSLSWTVPTNPGSYANMSEIMAKINAEHLIELIDNRSQSIASAPPMTPQDTAVKEVAIGAPRARLICRTTRGIGQ
jgi:hypothetical protein